MKTFKSNYLILCLLFCIASYTASAQTYRANTNLPSFAIKTNLLYDAFTNMNLGVEFRLGQKITFDLPVSYNPWKFRNNQKWQHILVQPGIRFWTCEAFNGHFFSIHGHYAQYNAGNIDFGDIKLPIDVRIAELRDHRFEGWLAGAGISYGYQWILGNRFSLEFEIGVGWAYLSYDKYEYQTCGAKVSSETKNYFGPTKASVALVFFIK